MMRNVVSILKNTINGQKYITYKTFKGLQLLNYQEYLKKLNDLYVISTSKSTF